MEPISPCFHALHFHDKCLLKYLCLIALISTSSLRVRARISIVRLQSSRATYHAAREVNYNWMNRCGQLWLLSGSRWHDNNQQTTRHNGIDRSTYLQACGAVAKQVFDQFAMSSCLLHTVPASVCSRTMLLTSRSQADAQTDHAM